MYDEQKNQIGCVLEEKMEVYSQYPVRKIVIEFKDGSVFGNGRKYRDIYELIQWVKDTEQLHRGSSHIRRS